MPTCASESLKGMWPSDESLNACESVSSGFHSPGSPCSLSPTSRSPEHTLKRRRASSAASFVIRSDRRDSRTPSPPPAAEDDNDEDDEDGARPWWADAIGWYPLLLLRVAKALVVATLPATWRQLLVAVPTFWLSACAWCFWRLAQLPLTAFKHALGLLLAAPTERGRRKRTVLISGGSTIQALHLARNFYAAGARVVVCEVEGCFALARFSTAVSRFYVVPRPTGEQQQHYVRALCDIAHRERAAYYVPVSAATPAYFDAVAKPHLELLGCVVFAPGVREVRALDDVLELFKRCQAGGLALPTHHVLTSRDDLTALYENGAVDRCTMQLAGACGARDRVKLALSARAPPNVDVEVSEQRPWVVVRDVDGEHFVTCTTVKASQVVANVVCRHDGASDGLLPVEAPEVDAWLRAFFAQLHHLRPITGHVSFRLARCARTGRVLPLGARVGVGLPYVCYTSVHPRLLWKPCRHFSRQNSGPVVAEAGRHYMPETVLDAIKRPSLEAVTRLLDTVLDKREALFALWDPLPYCVYYHVQLPFGHLLGFVRRRTRAAPHFPAPMPAN